MGAVRGFLVIPSLLLSGGPSIRAARPLWRHISDHSAQREGGPMPRACSNGPVRDLPIRRQKQIRKREEPYQAIYVVPVVQARHAASGEPVLTPGQEAYFGPQRAKPGPATQRQAYREAYPASRGSGQESTVDERASRLESDYKVHTRLTGALREAAAREAHHQGAGDRPAGRLHGGRLELRSRTPTWRTTGPRPARPSEQRGLLKWLPSTTVRMPAFVATPRPPIAPSFLVLTGSSPRWHNRRGGSEQGAAP